MTNKITNKKSSTILKGRGAIISKGQASNAANNHTKQEQAKKRQIKTKINATKQTLSSSTISKEAADETVPALAAPLTPPPRPFRILRL